MIVFLSAAHAMPMLKTSMAKHLIGLWVGAAMAIPSFELEL
ncbi:MAG: hypothetical protein M0Z99_04440 [Betaproteobacteria bacterium]|nr:hypothetical protein [Betaproteobacteria bacterium]